MAHVRKQWKNGKWQYAVDFEDQAGNRRQKFHRTQEEADEHLAKTILESRQRSEPDPEIDLNITLSAYAAQWLAGIADTVKPRTLESYRESLERHVLPTLGHRQVRDLSRRQIRTLLVRKRQTMKRNSVRIIHATIRAMLNHAVDEELVVGNPAARLGKRLHLVDKKIVRKADVAKKAMDRDERDRFLATASTIEPRWAPMWAVQFRTGLRPGEIYALRETDIDFDKATLDVERTLADAGYDDGKGIGTPKGNRSRTVDLSTQAVHLLRRQLEQRKVEKLAQGWREMPEPIFCTSTGTYVDPSNIRAAFRRVGKKAGLPARFSPHSCRHTFAQLLLNAGKDVYYVSKMMGHASIQETVDTYATGPANRRGELDVLDDDARVEDVIGDTN